MTREEILITRVHTYCKSFLARSIYGECKAFCPFSDSELPKCSQRYIHEHPDEVERIPANEQELGQYDFRASNGLTADSFTCLIYLPGEWNQAGIHISVFIGPRYRDADLHET